MENLINQTIIGPPRRWVLAYSNIWLRPLIMVSVLLVAAYLGYRNSFRYYELILLLLPGIVSVFIFYRWPLLGLVAVLAGMAIPFSGPSNSNATMVFVALLTGIWLFDMIFIKREFKLVSSITVLPLLLLAGVAVLAFGVGQLPWYTFAEPATLGGQLGGLSLFILSPAAFLLVAHQVRNVRSLQILTWSFVLLSSILVIGRLIPGIGGTIGYLYSRTESGSLFWTWLVALVFGQLFLNNRLHISVRIGLSLLLGVIFYATFIQTSSWKSGWVPPLITIVAIVGLRFWKLGVVLLPFGVLPASWLTSYAIATDQYSYSTRLDAWQIVLEIAKVNPILGLGPANYRAYTILFPIRGYAVEFNSHSQYIDLIAETGILGLLCFLWIFAAVAWVGWKLRDRVPAGFPRAYVYGALGGLVGTLVAGALGDWVIPFFYNITLGGFRASVLGWLFLGGLVALEQIYTHSEAPAETTKSHQLEADAF